MKSIYSWDEGSVEGEWEWSIMTHMSGHAMMEPIPLYVALQNSNSEN